jgi:MinD-like ATPase involved in chromosome partitioning or flagellar assembly
VLLVTTPDDVAVMDAYATIKRGSWEEANLDLRVLVNACHDTATAVDVQSRLAAACRRFLGLSIGRAPLVSRHFAELDAISAPPLAWETSAAPFAGNIKQLGRFAADVLAQRRRAIGTRGWGPVCVNFIRPGTLSLDSSELPREFSRC